MECEYESRDDIIVGYVEGSLSGEAREAFEVHYFGCDRCFAQLQLTEKLVGTLQHEGKKIFEGCIRQNETGGLSIIPLQHVEDHAAHFMGSLERWLSHRRHRGALLALSLLIGAFAFWFLRYYVFHPDFKQLADKQPPTWPQVAPLPGVAQPLVEQAQEKFRSRQYSGAITSLTDALRLSPGIAELANLQYILGMCYYFADDLPLAIARFDAALQLNQHHEDARWYLANSYLKKNERKKAIEEFAYLVEIRSRDYGGKSREILKAIDPFYFLGRNF